MLTRTVVLQGLTSAGDITIAVDAAMFLTERCRGLSGTPGGTVTRLFGTSGPALVADRVCVGQRGVHGVALDRPSPPTGAV